MRETLPIRSIPTIHSHSQSRYPREDRSFRSLRLKNALLPPRLPLLLPRRLTVPKRKPTRPLIRPRRLAHPSHLPAEQKRPGTKTKQRSIAHQPRRESETPPAHQLRVKVERRHRLERHGHRRSRFS